MHGRDLDVLQRARKHGCEWNEEILCKWRAAGAVAMGAGALGPGTEGACAGAAEGGHLEVLKWARAHDCPWHEEVLLWCCRGRGITGAYGARRRVAPSLSTVTYMC